MSELQYKDKVVIVTGAGGGLGKAYSVFFASRGANILVNDLSRENADKAVKEINDAGKGQAIANYNSATEGNAIVKQAVDKWGRVDILINNAGILRDKSFASMTDKEWDSIHDVHVRGAYACTKAAWPLMRKQKYGRIIMASHLEQSPTASAAGIYGNFGQANYSSAKLALVAFAKTLAREGAKYNIHANAIAPVAASQMTETVMPPEMLANLSPEMIVPLVAYLCHDQTEDNGKLFEAGAGWYGRVRWERSKGVVFKTDDTFTPAAVKAKWEQINDFSSGSTFPENITDANYLEYLEEAKSIKKNETDGEVRFDGKTILVTGAGAGLGRAYALMYAKLGGSVVVNDMNKEAADSVVKECEKLGGKALAVVCSAEEGEKLVNAAVEKFGSLHVVVCNAGILRDKSFAALTDEEWDFVYNVHVRGTYSVCKAAWPIFRKQKYGRIVNTSSSVGVHGNFGQANYSTAKSAILGLTKTLAIEGKKYGIIANTLVPNAGTNMTRTIWPEEMVQAFSPAFIAPVVGYLTSEANESTLGLYEVSGGWCAAYRWQRSYGHAFPINTKVTVEKLKAKWDVVNKFDNKATNPNSTAESLESIIDNFSNESESSSDENGDDDYSDPEDSEIVKKAKESAKETGEYTFTERDVALYNLGIGATEKEVEFTFEGDSDFRPIPTFGVIPQFATSSGLPMDWLPNFSPMMLLHGEQYLQIKGKIPTSGTLTSAARLSEVLDKGKAAAVTSITTTKDSEGNVIFENQSTVFIRGAGGFGGKKTGKDRGAATAANKPPSRKPDHVEEEKTLPIQAALYRLSGDYNPLHIDPDFAKVGGFDQPILHGLCFFGISGKHIYKKFGEFKDIKVRFVGSVYPGETVVTEMWKENDKVIFQTKCKERGTVVLGAAAVTLA
ncbi:BZ3500_MvSof-1268-A1-R1_Chr2-2g04909 [Microbotryum saponariae]|uniref:BZ3500_MvSof-1268-A1-R1_Chr2-2g04909 protein n=1 Tax=Microbotryum saponariae TaxID=289078 RepID=A0A2X0L7E3_9BASI|nr:BZ3500_MvSof-1268-A1-R1_Chr2-2g04909 [Microbotryum saponariae]SDA00458.1 BZ3501_MvSof-1269-A2-R1_Chr2-2g04583 [Microbotryum saponariae]